MQFLFIEKVPIPYDEESVELGVNSDLIDIVSPSLML
jgi:hypothetical protein